jgi:drug/metabolite transporter (DMT)-like permease
MTDSRSESRPIVELALLVLLATLWGASYTFMKIAIETIPPLTLIAARTLIAGTLLAIVLMIRGVRWPRDARTWRGFLIQAGLNSVVPFTLIAWAVQTIDAGSAVILNSMTPIFTFLLALLLVRRDAATVRKLIGVGAGFAGVILIVGLEALAGLGRVVMAQTAVVAASICYAGAALFGGRFRDLDPMLPAAGSLVCGAAVLIPLSVVVDQPWTLAPSWAAIMAVLALAVASTALAFVIYFRLIDTLGSIGVTAQSYLRAPIGVLIGVLLLGERPAPTALVGCGFVLAGVLAMTLRPGAPIGAAIKDRLARLVQTVRTARRRFETPNCLTRPPR